MADLIAREDKKKPLSDEALALSLAEQGVPCARRTVTKYRKNLHIPAAAKRRRWN
jgi:RNA polymerase sigma-54 factor